MKKIVALVLSLVMVLGLATVAFAAETTTTVKKDGYSVVSMDNTTSTAVAADFTKTVKDKTVVTTGAVTTTTYFADKYVIDTQTYYACDASIATAKLVKAGAVVEFMTTVDLSNGATKTATAFVTAKPVADRVCGDYNENVYVVDGKNYAVGTAEYVVYNGKFVGIAATPSTNAVTHDFTKLNITTDTKGAIVAIKCDTCAKTLTVVGAGKVPATYAGAVDTTTLANNGCVILLNDYVAPAVDGEKVESAETFDAGIAMYVGMSVMAAAGSAVVLKKKD